MPRPSYARLEGAKSIFCCSIGAFDGFLLCRRRRRRMTQKPERYYEEEKKLLSHSRKKHNFSVSLILTIGFFLNGLGGEFL